MEPFRFKQFSVRQDESALKTGTDAVLLGALMTIRSHDRSLLDIGTGTGVIALMAAQRLHELLSAGKDRGTGCGRADGKNPETADDSVPGTDTTKRYSNAAQSDAAQSNTAQCNSAKSNGTQCNGAKSDSAQCDSAQSDAAQCNSAKSNGTQCNGAKSDSAQSDAAQCNSAKSNGAQCNGEQCNCAQCDGTQCNAWPEIHAIDIDAASAHEAAGNFKASPWSGMLSASHCSLEEYHPVTECDLIFSNPPFYDNSLRNPDAREAAARHTESLSFRELVAFASIHLSACGRLSMILPAESGKEATACAVKYGLQLFRIVHIRTTSSKPPRRVILEFCRKSEELSEETLTLQEGLSRTEEYRELMKPWLIR